MAYLVGVTGGAGTGKSVFSRTLQSCGAWLLDADQIAREIVNTNENVRQDIRNVFGNAVFDDANTLKRRALARLVFSDDKLRQKLNHIVWPHLTSSLCESIRHLACEHPDAMIVTDMAVLFEAGMQDVFDVILLIRASRQKRRAWLANRHWSPEEIDAIITLQGDYDAYVSQCQVMDNSGSLEDLQRKASSFYTTWKISVK